MMSIDEFIAEWQTDEPRLMVHTSGSTGQPKPLWVEKSRMAASARLTCDFLGLHEGDSALLCLPLDFIAGKMMVVRALVRGLRLLEVEPCGHPLQQVATGDHAIDFAAMVPLQVWNSLQVETERKRLMAIRHLIIGGGAIDEALAAALRDFPNAVWSTYGMTETLSHIALRRLNGAEASEWYRPLPGVTVTLNADDCIVIDAPRVCPERLTTNDIGLLSDSGGEFRILGRRDNVICSGGLKIQAEEVERRLAGRLACAFMVVRCHDERLGECVALLTEGDVEECRQECEATLPRHWQPRRYLHINKLPMTPTGKPARAMAQNIVEQVFPLSKHQGMS